MKIALGMNDENIPSSFLKAVFSSLEGFTRQKGALATLTIYGHRRTAFGGDVSMILRHGKAEMGKMLMFLCLFSYDLSLFFVFDGGLWCI